MRYLILVLFFSVSAHAATVNIYKLTEELTDAGIPIEGCNSSGDVAFAKTATAAQREQAKTIVAAHNPAALSRVELAAQAKAQQIATDKATVKAFLAKPRQDRTAADRENFFEALGRLLD